MTSRGHLIPTLTVDKNGRTTTVHRKPMTEGAKKSIPMPMSTGIVTERSDLINDLANKMRSAWSGGSLDALTKGLGKYPDDVLERLVQAQVTDAEKFLRILRIAVTKNVGPETLNEYLCFLGDLDSTSYYAARDHIASLHQYTQLPETEDFSNGSEELKSKCRALIEVQRACSNVEDMEVFRLESGAFVIDDDDLVELILEHPDKATRIADFIREREAIDAALIAEVINGDVSALGSGTL